MDLNLLLRPKKSTTLVVRAKTPEKTGLSKKNGWGGSKPLAPPIWGESPTPLGRVCPLGVSRLHACRTRPPDPTSQRAEARGRQLGAPEMDELGPATRNRSGGPRKSTAHGAGWKGVGNTTISRFAWE